MHLALLKLLGIAALQTAQPKPLKKSIDVTYNAVITNRHMLPGIGIRVSGVFVHDVVNVFTGQHLQPQ